MKTLLFALFATIGIALSPCTAAEKSEWLSLFNGKDLAGWTVVHDASFVVTNSNLRLVTGMGWLRTDQQYTNFVLELEWRALEPGYDSGIFIRASTTGKPWPENGWQVNLLRTSLGGLVRGTKLMVPAENAPVPLNQWVKFRIEAKGTHVSLDVDGERAWEYDKLDSASGFIGFQAENKPFEFRNIRLLPLKE